MARLASEAKAGFYPTPIIEMELICSKLKIPHNQTQETYNILDPCAGMGDAIVVAQRALSQSGATVKSYGIEIEETRAIAAQGKVDSLLHCSYDEARMSQEAFSLLYLNPPFQEMGGERMEKIFLEDLTEDRLGPGGILVFNIPQPILKKCAKLLASRFIDLSVYRFTDDHFDAYKQVIVFGRRRQKGFRKEHERAYQQKMEERLQVISQMPKDKLPSLDRVDDIVYELSPAPKKLMSFYSTKVTMNDILNNQGLDQEVKLLIRDFEEVQNNTKKLEPALPLQTAHLAAALQSGYVPEQMGADHLLVSRTQHVESERTQISARSEKEQRVTTYSTKNTMRIFSKKGIVDLG
ncbi:class I SAM-dependent methyltransferase [Alkalihalobacillus oceani]|uniref:Class I SAM-dependent methyltransferase n=1 Tax=Halalkalibacter oceani TaxID=1653776 RepID=A0A9X2DSM5_9BACI|nr:DUF6094 domain-containing protein [Halalkalibacter oceani]MCM3716289.1 class I SAM-dependent methyltransferase [Halalkalibacter oceani]